MLRAGCLSQCLALPLLCHRCFLLLLLSFFFDQHFLFAFVVNLRTSYPRSIGLSQTPSKNIAITILNIRTMNGFLSKQNMPCIFHDSSCNIIAILTLQQPIQRPFVHLFRMGQDLPFTDRELSTAGDSNRCGDGILGAENLFPGGYEAGFEFAV